LAGIRIVGSISGEFLYEGIHVRMTKCGISQDGSAYYHFEQVSDIRESVGKEWA
jgi:hypothetical protein